MQKWDYLVLGIIQSYGINYRVNGEKVGEWKDFPLHDVLNIVGKQGFELISFDGANYIFKRATQATSPLKTLNAQPNEA